MNIRTATSRTAMVMLVTLLLPQTLLARPLESRRMERAKDLIAEEQWLRAIDELKAAVADDTGPSTSESRSAAKTWPMLPMAATLISPRASRSSGATHARPSAV